MKNRCFIFGLLIQLSFFAQTESDSLQKQDSSASKRFKIIGLPIAYYAPETELTVGLAGIASFQFKNDSIGSRPSSFQFGAAYTQLHQILLYAPYQLWLKKSKYNLSGELGYYRYIYSFWGIGGHTPEENKENYSANYPRLRFTGLVQIRKNIFLGIKYGFDQFKIVKLDSSKQLYNSDITGNRGGTISFAGLGFKFDNRDNQFYPSKGYFLETSIQSDHSIFGSNFSNVRFLLDASTYYTFKFKHTLAFNTYLAFSEGKIAFFQLNNLGGSRRMRGYFEGRYRDKHMLVFQTEYRAPIYKRFGAVAFLSSGSLASKINNFQWSDFKWAYGAGLRFMIDKKQHINLRLDLGFAEGKSNFYLTFSEAF